MQMQEEMVEKRSGHLINALRSLVRVMLIVAIALSFIGFVSEGQPIVVVVDSSVYLKCFSWAAIMISGLGFALIAIGSLIEEHSLDSKTASSVLRLEILAIIVFVVNFYFVANINSPWKIDVGEPDYQGGRTVELYYMVHLNETLIVTYEVGPQSIIAHQTGSEYGFERSHRKQGKLGERANAK